LLAKNNFHVDVFCLKPEPGASHDSNDLITVHGIIQKKPKESFFEYLQSTILFGVFSSLKLLKLRLRKKIPIVMVATLPEMLVFFVCWIRLAGGRLLLDARDLTVELLNSRWQTSTINFVKIVSILIERYSMRLCDDVITANNGFMRSLVARKIPPKKLTVIFNTSDTSIFKPDPNRQFVPIKNDLRLIYHGTVSNRFGVIVGIEAVSLIRQVIPEVKFIIHGAYDPKYLRTMKERIEQLNLHENILLNECVSLQEISNIIKTVHIGLVPYLSDPFMNLALSTKTFEYIASGLPVVVSRLKSNEELFDNSCIHYAKPGDPQDLADKIIDFAKNPSLRKQKAESAFLQFQQYSDKVMGERFLNLIKKNIV
jgi:glycosyltransferase involved in cell wall biosynthesis